MPQVPTKDESEMYYFGLSNPIPKLLARTSETKWKPTTIEKVLYSIPVGNKLVLAVNNGTLSEDLEKVLQAANPTSVTVTRIGYRPSEATDSTEILCIPIIFWVGVMAESEAEPETALEAAKSCKNRKNRLDKQHKDCLEAAKNCKELLEKKC